MDKCSTLDNIEYILKRNPGQKSIRIHIDGKGRLVLSCSTSCPQSKITEFINKNVLWIDKHKNLLESYNYENGEKIPLLGYEYELLVSEGKKYVTHGNGVLAVRLPDSSNSEKLKKLLYGYYKQILMNFIPQRLAFWCSLINVEVPVFSVNNSKSRWGVCYFGRPEIKISAMTACLPEDLIDMTIFHEVCHLIYHNHSPEFWNLMKRFMPDLDSKKERLKKIERNNAIHTLF